MDAITQADMLLKRTVRVAKAKQRERDEFLQAFNTMRPKLEERAAAGDNQAAQLLAEGDAFLKARLAFVPIPDREGYLSLEWVVDADSEDSAQERES